jgi:uncharacterized protein
MNAPFFKFGLFGDNVSLILAFIIGIAFGFALERAGFGSVRKLTAQFYFTDLAVFKVMFTAIVTAMTGLFYLAWIGVVDLSQVYLTPTYIVPQSVGGLLLGVGFVVGGYCPGTSCVAVSTGKIDAIVFLAGIVAGIFVFGEMFPILESFYNSTPMGTITLPQLLHVPYGVVVLLVILMAVGGFAGATWVEKTMAARKEGEPA